jgi:hypothetical protein
MKGGPLAVLEEIRSVCLVKIVPNGPEKFEYAIKSSSLERTNTSQVWNYIYAFRHLARAPHAVGRERRLYSRSDLQVAGHGPMHSETRRRRSR